MTTPTIKTVSFKLAKNSINDLLDIARDYFVSEQFSRAIELMNEQDEIKLSNDDVLALLSGDALFEVVDGELKVARVEDEPYCHTAREILANYDFLMKDGDKILQLVSVVSYSLKNSDTELGISARANEGKFQYENSLMCKLMREYVHREFDAVIYLNGNMLFFSKFNRCVMKELCKFYTDLTVLMDAFQSSEYVYS